jgi:hypothetical protein
MILGADSATLFTKVAERCVAGVASGVATVGHATIEAHKDRPSAGNRAPPASPRDRRHLTRRQRQARAPARQAHAIARDSEREDHGLA